MQTTRITIYPKDVAHITGKSDRYARNVLNAVRENYGKQKYQPVSVVEFCRFMGLTLEEISPYLS